MKDILQIDNNSECKTYVNDIVIFLETDTKTEKIIFKNYIAIDYIGQWDECIVESIYEESDNDIIQNALKKVNERNGYNRGKHMRLELGKKQI